jgi:hypothetical protein
MPKATPRQLYIEEVHTDPRDWRVYVVADLHPFVVTTYTVNCWGYDPYTSS